ncbi:hypothetical protein LguiB_027248 [Lonicera macranthoides]
MTVVVQATAERVIFASNTSIGLSAIGVIYRDTNENTLVARIGEKGEIILSAGTLGSPQLLLMSGVGPRSYLSSLNIPIVYNQPFIGQFITDNPRSLITITPPFPLDDIGFSVVSITKSFYIEIISALPTNPSLTPIVLYNYFNDTRDLSQCANAMCVIGKMLRTPVMEQHKSMDQHGQRYFKFVGQALPQNQFDDEAMGEFCRKTLSTIYHYHGGCLAEKVVDSHLKVIGINTL